MNLTKVQRIFIAFTTVFAVICGGIGVVVLHQLLPDSLLDWYPFIPVYFYILSLCGFYLFDKYRQQAPKQSVLIYLGIKVARMILSVLVLMVYCMKIGIDSKVFLLTFISFYLLYLIYETWFYFSFEVGLKKKKEIKNETVV